MYIALISIFVIGSIAWAMRRALGWRICPICAGVSGTWGWMLGAQYLGFAVDTLMIGILMGGSVVGIAYQGEKRLSETRSPMLWKLLFIPAGFASVYGALMTRWDILFAGFAAIGAIALVFFWPRSGKGNATVSAIEKQMEQCC